MQRRRRITERDDTNFKAVLKASGRDTGGKGNASATITAELVSVTPTSTTCNVVTDLSITGKVAQFGRGALADVSEKILAQFADNLNTLIDEQGTAPAPAPAPEAAAPATNGEPQIRKIEGPAAEPLNLGEVAGGQVMKRLLPIAAGLAAALLFIRRLFRRRKDS